MMATPRFGTLSIWALPAAFAVLSGAAPWLSDYVLETGFRLLVLMTLAEAWNLMAGYAGMVSLGTASFFGVGAYVLVGLVNSTGAPLPVALVAAGLSGALMAVVLSRAVLRLRGLYFTVGTFAMSEALRLFMINYGGFGGASGWFLQVDPPDALHLYWLALGLFALSTLCMTVITRSRVSILLRAVRDDEDAAAQIGIKPFRIKLLAFVVASVLTSLAGALQGLKLGAIEPYGTFGMMWTVNVLSIVLIGGQGLRAGPVVGALFIVALSEWLADYPALHMAFTGAVLILVIRVAPKGIAGLASQLFAKGARP